MVDIITDISQLHKKSTEVDIESKEYDQIIKDIIFCFPPDALGLAAPQVGSLKRMFLANLSFGKFVFINPEITYRSPDKSPSIEACLSLPGIFRCVKRHMTIEVKSPLVLEFDGSRCEEIKDFKIKCKGMDAFIVQHENDHLDGILITDLSQVKTKEEASQERQIARHRKIKTKRLRKLQEQRKAKHPVSNPKKLSKKARFKMRKETRKLKNRLKKCVERREKMELLKSNPASH